MIDRWQIFGAPIKLPAGPIDRWRKEGACMQTLPSPESTGPSR